MKVLVLGGSVTGGGGVHGNLSLAWPNLVNFNKTVHFKNAVDSSYFMHCSSRFVSQVYDITLYDLGPNMWDRYAADNLANLVLHMSKLTKSSISALIDWPRRDNVYDSSKIERAAKISHSNVIHVLHSPDLYAEAIHPNKKGHLQIAKAVTEFLTRSPHKMIRHQQHLYLNKSKQLDDDDEEEFCFNEPSKMPIISNSSWKIVDDGFISHKFGWASYTQGAKLRLNIPKTNTCGSIITVSYLRTNSSGVLKVECSSNCMCAKIRAYHQRSIYPFPFINTRIQENIKITETTSFYQLRKTHESCQVDLVHVDQHKVRIDGIFVKQASEKDAKNARGPGSQLDQITFSKQSRWLNCTKT